MDFWKNIILYCWIIEQMVIALHIMFAQNLGIIDHHILQPSCRTLRHADGHFWEIGKLYDWIFVHRQHFLDYI